MGSFFAYTPIASDRWICKGRRGWYRFEIYY